MSHITRVDVATVIPVSRRDDVINAAADLLREAGPDALTSIAVAKRLGMSQSAIYRHISDMQELTTVASHIVVAELTDVMAAAIAAPETEWGDGANIVNFSTRIVGLMSEHRQAFEVIDRWRWSDGELGEGIRALLVAGCTAIAGELESQWRFDFACTTPFDEHTAAIQRAHAQLIEDDTIAVARTAGPPDRDVDVSVARMLSVRIFAGWSAYALDMNGRLGLPTPILGGPHLLAPEFSLL